MDREHAEVSPEAVVFGASSALRQTSDRTPKDRSEKAIWNSGEAVAVRRILDRRQRRSTQLAVTGQIPEQRVGVQQRLTGGSRQIQPRGAAKSSARTMPGAEP
jgi:hypothetical protein